MIGRKRKTGKRKEMMKSLLSGIILRMRIMKGKKIIDQLEMIINKKIIEILIGIVIETIIEMVIEMVIETIIETIIVKRVNK